MECAFHVSTSGTHQPICYEDKYSKEPLFCQVCLKAAKPKDLGFSCFFVEGSVHISVISSLAPLTLPASRFQVHHGVELSADSAGFGSRFPPVNVDNLFAVFLCLMLKFQMERMRCNIRYLSSPEAFHTLKREGFKHQHIVSEHQMLRQFPVMVCPLTGYLAMRSCQVLSSTFTIVATALLPRMRSVRLCYLLATAFVEFRRLVLCSIAAGEQCLDTKVKPCRFTSLR